MIDTDTGPDAAGSLPVRADVTVACKLVTTAFPEVTAAREDITDAGADVMVA